VDIQDAKLKYLYESYKRGTMRAASEHFGMAPSSISRQIASLERELGMPLVEKGHHTVKLTPAGKLLVDYYRDRLGHQESLVSSLDDLRGLRRGGVTIAVGQGLLGAVLVPVMKRFLAEYPGLRLHLREVATSQALTMVCEDEAHFGVLLEPPSDPQLRTRLAIAQPVRLIMQPAHVLAKRKSVAARELVGHALVLPTNTFRTRQILERIEQDEGFRVDPVITSASIPMICNCVREGIGMALLPEMVVASELRAGQLIAIPLEDPAFNRFAVHVVTRLGRHLPKSALLLLDMLERESKSVVARGASSFPRAVIERG
jgi:DNA-binding transcriptional LysR family regulator